MVVEETTGGRGWRRGSATSSDFASSSSKSSKIRMDGYGSGRGLDTMDGKWIGVEEIEELSGDQARNILKVRLWTFVPLFIYFWIGKEERRGGGGRGLLSLLSSLLLTSRDLQSVCVPH